MIALQAPILALNDSAEVFIPLLLQKFRMGPSEKVTGKNSKSSGLASLTTKI